ncbi:MAG: efflux RND transporter periplasmic adaptor subunit, partial [Planctomycetes bacterium]|nr:efflux RND transporter periplasmic adaptor subunit [Planctomycetota bacterium]
DRTEIHAPIDGIVMRRLAVPGSRVQVKGELHASHIVHVYDPSEMQVRVDVPLADAASVGVGQSAEIVVQVLPDRVFHGRVTRFVHVADVQKNTVEVKVHVEAPAPELKPDMLARVRFLAQATGAVESRQRLLIPEDHVVREGGIASAWVVVDRIDDRGRAELRTITLGSAVTDGWREVTDGLLPGDWLIDRIPAGLEPGDAVTIRGEARRGGER